jgi:crotonobetainyl-CoA:carnitine CoA-transferase CaiB-like acyl-CoA transferase
VMQMPSPIRFSGAPARENIEAPELGKHSREVLGEYGFSQSEIESLIERQLV